MTVSVDDVARVSPEMVTCVALLIATDPALSAGPFVPPKVKSPITMEEALNVPVASVIVIDVVAVVDAKAAEIGAFARTATAVGALVA